ncbi:SspB-related isopeptide-forming adhesin [Ligilactobacillus salivarius]|uniref:LPXTG-motif cell wall anchor domain protein n=1 Tax=Ligilactobacillus salivarius TaxID=1624 RepID=A0A089QJ36_9LACO|nr:SspB-related isopeptide-forming adhesin [Ligilactobacillus salivarius]AIR11793.1 LPXTG-motif cell wall anchor domain protein [Ligilactobacillus salivarius]
MAKNNLINNSTDSITRKKMYKSGKNWVVATLTAASLTGMVLVSNLKVADADSVTPTSPSSSSSSTTSSDKSATYSVTVDHSQLDNSVKQAQSTGVQVTQNPTTSTVVEASEASKAVDNISQNYQQQTNEVKQATERQTVKNETYAKDVVDANSTNAANKAKIDEAVKNLQDAGGEVKHNSSLDKSSTATIDNYSSVKSDVNNNVNQTVQKLKDATDQANANNQVNNARVSRSELDKSINNAKSVLGTDKVIKDATVNYGSVNKDNASKISQSIKDDYAKQVTSINTTVKQYQDAVSAAGSISKDELENAVKNAQNILGKNNVSQDPTVTKTTTVGNTKATVDEVNQDYQTQLNNINQVVQKYQQDYANWEKSNKQFLEEAASKTGWSVQQVLDFLGKNLPNVSYVSAGSNMTFDKGTLQSFSQSELNSILSNPKVDPGLKGYLSSKAFGDIYKLAQGTTWKYNNAFTDTKSGKSIDLKVTVQGLGLDYSGRYGLPPMIMVGEKYIGSDVAGIGAVKYGLTFLEHGTNTPINITSLIGVGDVDAAQSVAVYNAVSALRGSENKDYSGNGYLGSINTTGVDDFSEGKNTQYQSWFLVPNSSTVSYVFSAADPAWGNGAPDGSGFMGFYHQNLGGIPLPIKSTPPTTPEIHYHLDSVTVEKPTVHHHDVSVIPGSRIKEEFGYNNLSVDTPTPETASYNYSDLLVKHEVTKSDSVKSNNTDVKMDGKTVVAGSKLTYKIETDDFQASTGTTTATRKPTKSYVIVDKLPDGTTPDINKITVVNTATKQDLTKNFTITFDNATNTVRLEANDALIKMINADLTKTYPKLEHYLPTTVTGKVINLNNIAKTIIDGIETGSNIVTNEVTTSNPEKTVNIGNNNADGKYSITNDTQKYVVTVDYSSFANVIISDDIAKKELSFTDNMIDKNNVVQPNINSIRLLDKNGKAVDSNLYTPTVAKTATGYSIKFTIKDPVKFIKAYGGQKLNLEYTVRTRDGVTGDVLNNIIQNNFDVIYSGNTTTVHVIDINPKKDVVSSIGSTESLNGKTVPIDSVIYYRLDSSNLPADRATNVKSWSFKDPLDNKVVATGDVHILANGDLSSGNINIKKNDDITKYFNINYDKGVYTISPTDEYKSLTNKTTDKANSYSIYIGAKVVKAGWAVNTATEELNGDNDKTNEVKTFSFDPVNPKGSKDVNSGEVSDNLDKQVSINGKQVVPGDTVSFQLKGQSLAPYHETVKDYMAEDTLSDGLEYLGYKAFIVGDDGKQVDVTSMIKEIKSDNTVTYVGTEGLNKLLNSDEYNTKASKTPTIVLYAKVSKYFSGKIDNNYKLYINGKSDISNTVEIENKTPNPTKEDKNEDGVDINGKAVPRNSTNVFYLHWNASQYKDAIATKDAIQKGFYYVDDYPDDALQAPSEFDIKDDVTGKSVDGFTTMNYASLDTAPKEVQDMLKANGIEVKGAFVVIAADDSQKFFDTYVKAGHNLTIELPLTLRDDFKAGSYKNRAFEIDFGEGYPTNEVENTVIKTSPDKDVIDDNGKSVKDKYVTAGDIMHYVGTWDLTGYKNFALTKGQIAKGLSIFDDYDENVLEVSDLNKQALTIVDSTDNKAIDMSMVEINWDDAHGKWTISAKDPQKFLETYGGHALKVNFFAKVKKDAKGDIKNTIVQNDFGNETETDVVTNHVSVSDPLKDVVVSLTDNHSLNNGVVKLGDTLYYKLDSKTREAGEAYDTTSWGFVDKLDITHDLYTGQALVKARYDIKLKDGSTIKAGDDITKYFDITYDAQTGEFKVMAKKEFLDIINSDDNKATKQGFDVYLQAKRIKAGDVENTAQEIYNGEVINTNTVKTHTDEPEEPKPEIPQVPEVPNTPSTPQKTVQTSTTKATPTPAIEKATVLPQTGDSKDSTLAEVGLLAVALAGGIGLAGYKKKKTE